MNNGIANMLFILTFSWLHFVHVHSYVLMYLWIIAKTKSTMRDPSLFPVNQSSYKLLFDSCYVLLFLCFFLLLSLATSWLVMLWLAVKPIRHYFYSLFSVKKAHLRHIHNIRIWLVHLPATQFLKIKS